MKEGGVYRLTNTIDNFMYIGSCKKFNNRLTGHIQDCKRGKGNLNLTAFLKKYGWEYISFEILEVVVEFSELIIKENFWISKYPFENLWNCAPTAGTNLGVNYSETFKNKASVRMIGNTLNKGRIFSKEKGIKTAKYWSEHPDEKQKMIDKNRDSQRKIDKTSWEKGKIIEVFYEGILIDTVEGLKKVVSKYNLGHTTASKILQGKKEVLRGYSLKTIGSYFKSNRLYIRRYLNGEEIIQNII